jgi:glycosyltransferase involved in cell wall biosynthesis
MISRDWDYEVIVVDDGSTDDTSMTAHTAGSNMPLIIVRHDVNQGYGSALRSGFAHASKDWIFLTDGDGQFNINEIDRLAAKAPEGDIIIGFREHRRDHRGRLVNAWIFNKVVRLFFGLRVKDIDCAFKLMRRTALEQLRLEARGALISTELLVRAQRAKFRIVEVAVSHFPRKYGAPTGAKISVILRAIRELILFRFTGHLI